MNEPKIRCQYCGHDLSLEKELAKKFEINNHGDTICIKHIDEEFMVEFFSLTNKVKMTINLCYFSHIYPWILGNFPDFSEDFQKFRRKVRDLRKKPEFKIDEDSSGEIIFFSMEKTLSTSNPLQEIIQMMSTMKRHIETMRKHLGLV